jgi:glycosyltransferase involved in cell wall biosynthesis
MFDYMMAGLAVLASDLPGLNDIIKRSRGGLLYQSGRSEDLAEKLMRLYDDRALLAELAANARSFALREGNLDFEAGKLQQAFSSVVFSADRISVANLVGRHSRSFTGAATE